MARAAATLASLGPWPLLIQALHSRSRVEFLDYSGSQVVNAFDLVNGYPCMGLHRMAQPR